MQFQFWSFLEISDFNHMMNCLDHAADGGSGLLDHRVVHFAEAELVKGKFLHLGRIDTALYLSDFDLCHFLLRRGF